MMSPRFRIRTLMIAVACVGLAVGATLEGMRFVWLARHYRQTGQAYARHAKEAQMQEHEALYLADSLERSAAIQTTSPDLGESAANARKLAAFHHETSRRNGRRAAHYSRLSVKYL